MKISLRSTDSPAIRQLLLSQLQAAISLYTETLSIAVDDVTRGAAMKPEAIPLYGVQDDKRVLYRSAIALPIASLCQLPPLDIATQLATYLLATSQDTADRSVLEFNIEVVTPGWIYFQLTDQGIATWLQHLTQTPPILFSHDDFERIGEQGLPHSFPDATLKGHKGSAQASRLLSGRGPDGRSEREGDGEMGRIQEITNHPSPITHHQSPITLSLFPVQYAHARCCSLLRLGHRQGKIRLSNHTQKAIGHVVEPNPIPWLNATQQLHLVHPAERHLIAQLLGVLDELSGSDRRIRGDYTPNLVKLAFGLSDAMTSFYSSCRIWGEVQTQTPELAQARLGLVGVTQSFLSFMLQDWLGIPAPVEL